MVLFKSLSGSSRVVVKNFKYIFPCSLLIFLGLFRQLMVDNSKEIKYSYYPTTNFSKIEKEYRKKFNLIMLDDESEETGKECTLGN